MDVWAGDGKREGPPQRFMIGGLIPGIQYRHRVRARNRAGWSPFSPAGSTTRTKALPPDRIGTPEVTSLESRRIVLEWVAPITNGKKLTNYEVQHREASIEEYEEELEMLAYEKAEREAAGIHDDDDRQRQRRRRQRQRQQRRQRQRQRQRQRPRQRRQRQR